MIILSCYYIAGIVKDCGISSADALEIPQSWTNSLIRLLLIGFTLWIHNLYDFHDFHDLISHLHDFHYLISPAGSTTPSLPSGCTTPPASEAMTGASWLVRLCLQNVANELVDDAATERNLQPLPVRLESLQLLAHITKGYFPALR